MFQRLSRAYLMTREASHAVLRTDRNTDTVLEFIDPHGAVFYTEAAAIACCGVN